MATMTISTGREKDAPSVDIVIHEPSTFDDPQWKKWGCDEGDICALALRQIRVDIANGGARKELRKALARGLKLAEAGKLVQKWVDKWQRGVKRGGAKVMDARGLGLDKKQIAHFESQGFTVLTD